MYAQWIHVTCKDKGEGGISIQQDNIFHCILLGVCSCSTSSCVDCSKLYIRIYYGCIYIYVYAYRYVLAVLYT